MPIFNTERDKLLISGDKHTIGYNHTNTVLAREMAATYSVCTRNGRNMLCLHEKWPQHALFSTRNGRNTLC